MYLMFVCFPFLSKIQSELLGSDSSRKKRHLKDDAVPSVFPYAPTPKKTRKSVGGANRQSRQEVGCEILMMQLTTVL